MPKKKRAIIKFHRFVVNYDTLDKMMFAHVIAIQRVLPSTSQTRAVELFMEMYGLTEDDYPLNGALNKFNVMRKDFYEFKELDKKFF